MSSAECCFGAAFKDFVLVAADKSQIFSIIVQKTDEDKVSVIDDDKLLACVGPTGDRSVAIGGVCVKHTEAGARGAPGALQTRAPSCAARAWRGAAPGSAARKRHRAEPTGRRCADWSTSGDPPSVNLAIRADAVACRPPLLLRWPMCLKGKTSQATLARTWRCTSSATA